MCVNDGKGKLRRGCSVTVINHLEALWYLRNLFVWRMVFTALFFKLLSVRVCVCACTSTYFNWRGGPKRNICIMVMFNCCWWDRLACNTYTWPVTSFAEHRLYIVCVFSTIDCVPCWCYLGYTFGHFLSVNIPVVNGTHNIKDVSLF